MGDDSALRVKRRRECQVEEHGAEARKGSGWGPGGLRDPARPGDASTPGWRFDRGQRSHGGV